MTNSRQFMTDTEKAARDRVDNDDYLREHEDILFYDWPNWEEHMQWVATAPVDEIIGWANDTQVDDA